MLQDVLILGAGPAGLSVATALARQLYRAVVFDSRVYRNARTAHMHNVPTWDHRNPAEFRAKARADLLARYSTITFRDVGVERVEKVEGGLFRAVDIEGEVWVGRRVVLATGVEDVMPELEGFEAVWGRGVYHCLFCDGYEDRGAAAAGVLAIDDVAKPEMAVHYARMAKRLAEEVMVYTGGDDALGESVTALIAQDAGIKVEGRRVVKLARGDDSSGVVVHLEDGTANNMAFLVHKPRTRINGPFVSQLGLELTEQGIIKTTPPFYETSVKGVFAVGDCASPIPAVVNAMAMGAFAASGLAMQLHSEPVPAWED